jgi:proline dehydrogenase
MSLLDRALVRALPAVPKPVVRRLSSRYIAGPDLADAVRCVRAQNARGKMATLDVLGEEIERPEEATAVVEEYLGALRAIEEEGLDSNISVKPTALGLKLDVDFCRENVERLVEAAGERGNFVRIDMEDSSTTDDTLALYRGLRAEGHENVGIVLQAALQRTHDDIGALAPLRPNVRVCKGIYIEPVAIAYQGYETVRFSFSQAMEELMRSGSYIGVATHDDWVVQEALTEIAELELGPDDYEFQMLLGVREDLGDELVREGHRLRVYVPYGQRWYEYSLRRLQENPKIATYVARDTLGRLRP